MIDAWKPPAGPKARTWARKHGFDAWRVARLVRLTDRPGTFLEGLTTPPPRYLRVNPLRAEAKATRVRLEARGFKLARTDLDPNVLRIHDAPISPGATQEHLLGHTTLQDLASAAPAIALAAQPGETVADLAAAPGIKTLHIGGDMESYGPLVAVEPEPARMTALRFNLERCGLSNTLLHQRRGEELPGEAWADRVLLDAPCTGEGTLPKDRSRRRGKPEEIGRLTATQEALLDSADRILRPGGRLVYATCTFAPEENEMQVQRLIERGYQVEDLPFNHCGGEPLVPGVTAWADQELNPQIAKTRRFMPGLHPTLGLYVASLRKPEAP